MALKIEAKRLMVAANVPVLPGATITDDDEGKWATRAEEVGYPLMVKASAGGGGKGMRIVTAPDDLVAAIAASRREAAASFGDGTVFVERALVKPRHVEVQIVGDNYGRLIHLGERDCSLQRRHQKVLEEAPAPGVGPEIRRRLYDAALTAGRTIGYTGAGTVEFLVADDAIFFLEVNTRLQVEHPVTEMIYDVDLVRMQIEIAAGEPLALGQADVVRPSGWAIEARLYAEDPAAGYLPSTGTLRRFAHEPRVGVRWDAGVTSGSVISPFYDSMLAKVIGFASTCGEAAARLAGALAQAEIHGIATNRDALVATLRHDAFAAGSVDTAFFVEHPEVLDSAVEPEAERVLAVALALVLRHRRRQSSPVAQLAPTGWRNIPSGPATQTFVVGPEQTITVQYGSEGIDGSLPLRVDDLAVECSVDSVAHDAVELVYNSLRCSCTVNSDGARHWVNGLGVQAELTEVDALAVSEQSEAAEGAIAPVPGVVVEVRVQAGDSVRAHDIVVVMEAMKMEHSILAGIDGVVSAVHAEVGAQVGAHDVLVDIAVVPA